MIDIHSHILYGIDDGAKSIEMSIEMLKMAKKSGISKIVATPHYNSFYNSSYVEINSKLQQLKKNMIENNLELDIYIGQEVYFNKNIIYDYTQGSIITINNSRYMLIELPFKNISITEVINTLYEFQIKGIVPIIAHPERCEVFIKQPIRINELIKEGYLFQLNVGSLMGDFGKKVQTTAKLFLKYSIYNFIGSDAHNITTRSLSIQEKINIIDKVYLNKIIKSSQDMLDNKDVVFSGKKIRKKRLFSILIHKE